MNHRKDIPEFDKFVVSSDVLLQPVIIDINIIIKIINIVRFILYPSIFYYFNNSKSYAKHTQDDLTPYFVIYKELYYRINYIVLY